MKCDSIRSVDHWFRFSRQPNLSVSDHTSTHFWVEIKKIFVTFAVLSLLLVLVFLRGLRVLWHSCAFADEIFKTCWKIHNLSQDQENQCHQVASRVYVTCEGSGNPNDAKKVLVIVIFKFVSIILTFSSNSELKLL